MDVLDDVGQQQGVLTPAARSLASNMRQLPTTTSGWTGPSNGALTLGSPLGWVLSGAQSNWKVLSSPALGLVGDIACLTADVTIPSTGLAVGQVMSVLIGGKTIQIGSSTYGAGVYAVQIANGGWAYTNVSLGTHVSVMVRLAQDGSAQVYLNSALVTSAAAGTFASTDAVGVKFQKYEGSTPLTVKGLAYAKALALTDDTTPTLSGTLVGAVGQGDELAVYSNVNGLTSKVAGTFTYQGSNWQFTPSSPLADGIYALRVVLQASGNTDPADAKLGSAPYVVQIDSQVLAPVVSPILAAIANAASLIQGTAEANAAVTVTAERSDGGTLLRYTTHALDGGSWSVDVASLLASVNGQPPDGTYFVSATQVDALGHASGVGNMRRMVFDASMNAQLQRLAWHMDAATPGTLDAGDVVRLSFDQTVALTSSSLPAAVWGTGALLAAVEPVAGKSRFWDVKVGTGHALQTQTATWAVQQVTDLAGNTGSVDVAPSLTAGLGASPAGMGKISMSDVVNDGVLVQGWATPGASLKLNWGGQLTSAFTADAQGHWAYTFYKNESLVGRKVPTANVDQSMALLQVASDQSTTVLWTQTVQVDDVPITVLGWSVVSGLGADGTVQPGQAVTVTLQLSEAPSSSFSLADFEVFGGTLSQLTQLTGAGTQWQFVLTADATGTGTGTTTGTALARVQLPAQALQDVAGNPTTQASFLEVAVSSGSAVVSPLSTSVELRAGHSAYLDLRDALHEMSGSDWQVAVAGLELDQSLNHGTRDAQGVWTVAAADWADLQLMTLQSNPQESHLLSVRYQQKINGVWTDTSRASVALSVLPWVQVPVGSDTEDWKNFTQQLQAWNWGLNGLSGVGVNVATLEGDALKFSAIADFVLGNVLAGSGYITAGGSHSHGVMQRIAGSMDSAFVGLAYAANIKWIFVPESTVVLNTSIGLGDTNFSDNQTFFNPAMRNGLGNVWTISAGNEGQYVVALGSLTKTPEGIVCASIDRTSGEVMPYNTGPGLWLAVPGNAGTSYASPMVAAQAALMLEVEPGLGARDVKNILALAATYYTTATPLKSFGLTQSRVLNGAGAHYSTDLGFGVSNVYNAVRLAADWLADGSAPQVMVNWQRNSLTAAASPVNLFAQANRATTISIEVTDDVSLESVMVNNTIISDVFSQMRIVLTSPSGTQSVLANGTKVASYYGALQMTSHQFFGESSKGTWTVSYEFISDTTSAQIVSNVSQVSLSLFGNLNGVDNKLVYTDQFGLHAQLADTHTKAQMGWLSDLNGGNDSLMLSAMNTDVQVHLGRHGWLSSSAFKVLMSPGTQIENAFGGDGNDVLVGLANAKSVLGGNLGSDVLMAYGAGSTLDGGEADDWLWLGGDTSAKGGQGNDRFMVFLGESVLTNTALVHSRVSDFDATQDSLMSYDTAGNFKLAQFDVSGNLSGWAEVTNTSVLQTLRSQLAQSDAPDVLGVTVAGTAAAPTLTLQWDQSPVHAVSSYAALTLNGAAPVSVVLDGQSLSLRYSGVGAGNVSGLSAGTFVLDTSDSQLYSSLGVKLAYQKMYVGSTGADTLNASGQSGAVAVFGQGGNDVLTGGAGADLLATPAGGQVRMTGGQGADVFRLQGGSWNGRLEVSDFSLSQGDRLDLDALLQNIGNNVFVEDCVQLTRQNFDAVLAFDLSGQKAFASSSFTVVLENVYAQPTPADMTLRTLLYGSGMAGVLG